jgi:hypothetical protein
MSHRIHGLMLAVTVVACTSPGFGSLPRASSTPVPEASGGAEGRLDGVSGSAPANPDTPDEVGYLFLKVRWPEQARAIQLLPASARTVRVTVRDSRRVQVATQDVTRNPRSNLSTAMIPVPSGQDYSVSVTAYAEEAPGPDAESLASGDASNIVIRKSKTTQVGITLAPTYAPAITSLSLSSGGVGTTVTLTGRNFGADRSLAYQVLFGQATASVVSRPDDRTIRAEVPGGARSGNVSVLVDGIPSVSTNPFSVIHTLTLDPPRSPILTGSTHSISVQALDPDGVAIPDPEVAFTTDDPAIATVDRTGLFTSKSDLAATVSVTVRSGIASDQGAWPILPRPVAVLVSPTEGVLNAQAHDGLNAPGFLTSLPITATVMYSDRSTDHAVRWSTSDRRLGAVLDGHVQSGIDAPAGRLVVTATAERDGRTSGTATFLITTFGQADVSIE